MPPLAGMARSTSDRAVVSSAGGECGVDKVDIASDRGAGLIEKPPGL